MVVRAKPDHIIAAILVDDLEQLRISGSAGGRKSAEVRRKRKDQRDAVEAYYREKREREEFLRLCSTNAHLVPFDPETAVEDF